MHLARVHALSQAAVVRLQALVLLVEDGLDFLLEFDKADVQR
jgi:hypothetical protein